MRLFSFALRRLSTAASTTAAKPQSVSQSLKQLKNARDPDKALEIYNTFLSSVNYKSVTARFAQLATVQLLAKSGRFSDIEIFLESHKSSPQVTQEYFVSSLIRSYSNAGMFQNALQTYEEMSDLGTPRSALSFNAILLACVKSKLYDCLITYFHEFPAKFGFSPDNFSYGMLIKAYCELGSAEIAIEKLNEMQGKGFKIEMDFTNILEYFYVKSRTEEAEKFWDYMVKEKGFKPGASAYSVKLRNVRTGDIDGFNRLNEEMNKAGISPDASNYHSIISFYCRSGMMDEAEKVYDEMLRQKGCKPILATFRNLVYHNCRIGEFLKAHKFFRESVEHRKIPGFNVLKSLAEGLAKTGHKEKAKALVFRSMKRKSPSNPLEAWTQLADSLGLAPDEKNESDLSLDETKESDLAPDETDESDLATDEIEESFLAPNENEESDLPSDDTKQRDLAPDETEECVLAPDETEECVLASHDTKECVLAPGHTQKSGLGADEIKDSILAPDDTKESDLAPDGIGEVDTDKIEKGDDSYGP